MDDVIQGDNSVKIISAKEAKRLADYYYSVEREIPYVRDKINTEAGAGKSRTTLYLENSKNQEVIVNLLRKEGYEVKHGLGWIDVSWRDADIDIEVVNR